MKKKIYFCELRQIFKVWQNLNDFNNLQIICEGSFWTSLNQPKVIVRVFKGTSARLKLYLDNLTQNSLSRIWIWLTRISYIIFSLFLRKDDYQFWIWKTVISSNTIIGILSSSSPKDSDNLQTMAIFLGSSWFL